MQTKLIEILVCPVCKGKLSLDKINNELICSGDKLAFPIKDGIPVMLEEQARNINE